MKTITIDIINERVINLLKELELLELIRVHKNSSLEKREIRPISDYKGVMENQPIDEIDQQLNELRSAWE